jgi:hypothetical protein
MISKEQRDTVERIRSRHTPDTLAHGNGHSDVVALLSILDSLPKQQEGLSGQEVSDLWERLRYVGANNSYLFFHELNAKGILDPAAVRKYLEAKT